MLVTDHPVIRRHKEVINFPPRNMALHLLHWFRHEIRMQ